MPRYRKLHTQTTQSLDVNDMPDDFTRLLWVMLPLALCREGRGMDNPSWVRSNIFPIRLDVTLEMIGGAMDWYAEHGMITRYAVNGRAFFLVPTFHKYQGNTVKETVSIYPPPLDDQFPTDAIPTPDLVQTESRPALEEVLTDSGTDSILNIQYPDSNSKAEAVCNSVPAPKTSPPSLPTSDSPKISDRQARLQEQFGTDPLSGFVKYAERQEAKTQGRPAGWGSVSADVWSVCKLVAAQFPCDVPEVKEFYNANTREMVLQQIDKWTGGATLLLEKFGGDVTLTLNNLSIFRRTFDGGFTVAGPQSLVNSVGPGLASKPASKPGPKHGRRNEYEPATDDERAEAWKRYAPALGKYIEDRGTDENLGAMIEEVAFAIGCDVDSARALVEAHDARASLAMEPIDVEAFFAEGE